LGFGVNEAILGDIPKTDQMLFAVRSSQAGSNGSDTGRSHTKCPNLGLWAGARQGFAGGRRLFAYVRSLSPSASGE